MKRYRHLVYSLVASLTLLLGTSASAQNLSTRAIDNVFGRHGQQIGTIYKVGFPRTDLHVRLHGVALRPGFALGSWAAFSGDDRRAMVMGDLVLLPSEVNPVLRILLQNGFQVTALHNHLLGEKPRVMYMHYMGAGPTVELAHKLKGALKQSATPLGTPAKPAKTSVPAWVSLVETGLEHKGTFSGGVLAVGVPHAGQIKMGDRTLAPALGVAESMNFQAVGGGQVASTGDFVLTADEVQPVLTALTTHHVMVEALHNHMLDETPRLFFVHFWTMGSPESVSASLRAVLSHIATK